jgi:dipeptidase E
MRLYLSSFRIGNRPDALVRLLAGRTRTALILNALDPLDPAERAAALRRETDALAAIGLAPVELDLRSYFGAPGRLRVALAGIDLLYAVGGNAFVLRRAYRQSGADALVTQLLAADALVYAGYSAGICQLVPSLRGIELVDDAAVAPAGYEGGTIWEGLGVLPFAIAPHYRSEHPESAAVERLVAHYIAAHVPFIALRDGEVVVVAGEEREVVG